MKLRNPLLLKILALAGAWVYRIWMATVRRRSDYRRSGRHPTLDGENQRYIYAFWHESILFGIGCVHPKGVKMRALISQHSDGEFITQIIKHLGLDVVRGSSTRGGELALLRMCKAKDDWHLTVTPDGPRGPRRQVQPGLIFLASRTGMPIVPFGVGYTRAWRAKSWDRFVLPCPGSSAYSVLSEPIHIPPDLGREGLEYYRLLIERQLHILTERSEQWAATGERPAPWSRWSSTPHAARVRRSEYWRSLHSLAELRVFG